MGFLADPRPCCIRTCILMRSQNPSFVAGRGQYNPRVLGALQLQVDGKLPCDFSSWLQASGQQRPDSSLNPQHLAQYAWHKVKRRRV
ncbi:uncharacterized protein LOC134809241 isoform X2 [Pan troglodytes]|uniref:uncharacterized protein LOC134809241 isoform X2 n=1 Tax=Pan troglodytes TaxID=9598 RepID=UPI0030134721